MDATTFTVAGTRSSKKMEAISLHIVKFLGVSKAPLACVIRNSEVSLSNTTASPDPAYREVDSQYNSNLEEITA